MKNILQQINWREVGQIVLQGLITLAVLTYLSGWYLGRWLHRANDQLAAAMVRLTVGGSTEASTPDPLRCSGSEVGGSTEPSTPTAAPMQHPLAMAADDLQRCLTAAQLRELTGVRSKLPKHRLAGMLVAC